jgi:hypothetical protein
MPTSATQTFADLARSYIREGLLAWRLKPLSAFPGLSPFQAEMIYQAFTNGFNAAVQMNTSPEKYAKSFECWRQWQPDMAPTAEAAEESAQRCRDNFECCKRLAIRDARTWEVMEDCYKLGWDLAMQAEAKRRREDEERAARIRSLPEATQALIKELDAQIKQLQQQAKAANDAGDWETFSKVCNKGRRLGIDMESLIQKGTFTPTSWWTKL